MDVKDVLNLRATCTRLNTCILQYNKYWFFQYFLKNKFEILFSKNYLEHVYGIKKKLANGETFVFAYINCLTTRSYDEVDIFVKDSSYDAWKKEANQLNLFNEGIDESSQYESAYCRMKYLKKNENFICPDSTHYDITPFSDVKNMSSVNIIDEKILKCYELHKDYFRLYLKYFYSRNIIKRIREKCHNTNVRRRRSHDIRSFVELENFIVEDLDCVKRDTNDEIEEVEEEINNLRREIEDKQKEIWNKKQFLKDKEEKSKQNMEEFHQLKEESNKIFG